MTVVDLMDRIVGHGAGLIRGRVERIEESGTVLVSVGEGRNPSLACDALRIGELAPCFAPGDNVLVAIVPGAPERAIVVGVIGPARPNSPAADAPPASPQAVPTASEIPDGAQVVRVRTLRIEADEQLVLKCGEGTVTLTRDGRVMLRGEHVLSRARGTNRIKGGSVAIN